VNEPVPGSSGPKTERIGVFGGTFDPPHNGHLAAAVNVRHALQLDRVLLVVAGVPWQKVGERAISPAADRMAMVEAAVAGVQDLEPSDLEIDRGGDSYTADTLRLLHEEAPGRSLFVILGRDAAAGLPTWERVDEVRAQAEIVVVDRPGHGMAVLPPGWDVQHVDCPDLEISSTDLRARAGDGRPLDFLVPPAVVSCIQERRLYRSGDVGPGPSASRTPVPRPPLPRPPRPEQL
jgi:nicotinate-nucleotide adenylyltransferase